jgi:(p)ppGpp synthase/HD superfamily hydrolase
MTWAEPLYSKEQINAAGKDLRRLEPIDIRDWASADVGKYTDAVLISNNWRGAHAYPLNTFQVNLRNTSRRFDENPIIAQRIKRHQSIVNKLVLQKSMKLTQMQDLGGCRAILSSVTTVRKVVDYYLTQSAIKHERASIDDYIDKPKISGYRGVHLVYRYFSDKKPKECFNGLKIEMQIRSRYQHAWATAVGSDSFL